MDIFDSHCHLDDPGFNNDLAEVVGRARAADVKAMMVVGIDAQSSAKAVTIANQYTGVLASVGVHPHDAKSCSDKILDDLKILATDPKVKAWGETGLDYNRMFSPQQDQEHWFIRQLEMGSELQLPMIFHERDSQGRFLQILRTHWGAQRKGVVHCFSGNPGELQAYLEMDLYIGITGIVTIKSRGEQLRQMVRDMPAERLLVETDAPYLTPTPERNKFRRNEPAFVRTVLHQLAAVRNQDPTELATIIWDNTCRFFGVSDPVFYDFGKDYS
jgi:TatD DNase family protein